MKNAISLFSICALLFAACSNNQSQQQNTEPTEQQQAVSAEPEAGSEPTAELQWDDGVMAAVMFMGYYDSFDAFKNSVRYNEACKACPQLKDIQTIDAKTIGEELYLLIPRDPMSSVAVNECTFEEYMADTPSGNGAILYRSEEGKAILIRCNNSDSFGNTLVNIVDNQGNTTTFSPHIDRNYGNMVLPNDGTIQELVLPLAKPINNYETADNQRGIKAEIVNGRAIVGFDKQTLTSPEVGMIDEEDFKPFDGYSAIEGQNGICCGVFLNHEELYMIMDNGGVKIIDLRQTMYTGDLSCSDFVTNAVDVKSFRVDSSHEGPDIVYAIDSKGYETAIPWYRRVNQAAHNESDGSSTMIKICSNWQIHITDYDTDYNQKSVRHGYIYPTDKENEYKVKLTSEVTLDAFGANETNINIERDLTVEDNIRIIFEGKTFEACD